MVELTQIRHRIGHCRRPHSDDLSRLEQTLRDIEAGVFRAAASFNRRRNPDDEMNDPVVAAWGRGEHEVAERLLDHARENYDVHFSLRYSHRPWASKIPDGGQISGQPGYLWHASWVLRSDVLRLKPFWEDYLLDAPRELLLYVCSPHAYSIDVSFPAVDDPKRIADAIGNCFDSLLTVGLHRGPLESIEVYEGWVHAHKDLDFRVQLTSPWANIDDTTTPIIIFDA